jgi:FtsH-binding integral membrane protein
MNNDLRSGTSYGQAGNLAMDLGLRNFMIGIYQKMGLGLLVTGALAYAVSTVPELKALMFQVTPDGRLAGYTMLGMIISFAPMVILLGSNFIMRSPNAVTSGALYWVVVALIGLSLGSVFLLYTGGSLASTFFITAAAFGGLSLAGYTTKKDLSGWGKFLIMAVIGLIVAMIANFFIKSSIFYYITSAIGVLVFSAFIAYDTQRLKNVYYELTGNQHSMAVMTNMGALSLYINFVNLFQFLLAFLGVRRD